MVASVVPEAATRRLANLPNTGENYVSATVMAIGSVVSQFLFLHNRGDAVMLRTVSVLLVPALLVVFVASAIAGDPKQAFTDPDKAGPDFAAQGEYVGSVETDQGAVKYGVQVIALGEGKFRGVGYPGGLPGAGWDGSEKDTAEGETIDGVVTFKSDEGHVAATIKDGVITVVGPDGNTIATFKKTVRKIPTLGAKPPQGAVVLFDGTSPDHFHGGRMTKDGLLMEGVTSKQLFGSHTIHIEFRTPFQPYARGQGRGNSGFYAQGRHEVQILDSFGLEGEWNECGGIYKVSKPKVNMCLPPLSWQTYDVDFTAAEFADGKKVKNGRMTVKHNGVIIHEDVEIPHTTVGARVREETPDPGPVYLQNHGNPVRFRNIWVVEKK